MKQRSVTGACYRCAAHLCALPSPASLKHIPTNLNLSQKHFNSSIHRMTEWGWRQCPQVNHVSFYGSWGGDVLV